MKKILFAIAAILFMFGTAQAGPFVSGAGGGGGGNTLWGLPLEQPDAADDGKYIQYQNATTSWILDIPAGGGDMTIAVWDGDANGYIDLDAGGTNTSLADPNADRIMFWDDSTGAIVWLTLGSGVTIIGTTISVDGLTIGTDVQAWSANLDSWATSAPTASMLALASGATPAYLLGLTSAIQTQIDGKQATDADLTTWAGITPAASAQLYIASGTTSPRLLGVPDFQSGTSDQVLMSAGVGKVPAWGTYKGSTSVVTVGTIATGTWEGTRVDKTHVAQDLDTGNLAAALTFADGDLIDLSGVTMTAGVDEGIAIPWWVDVAPATEKFYMAYDPAGNALYVREPGGWVNVGASAAAPTNAKYLVFGANANLTDERVLTEGLAIDFTDAGSDGGAYTIAFDPTEVVSGVTWAAGADATLTWTWNVSAGTDPAITFGNNYVNISSGKLLSGATDVYVSGATDVYVTDGGTGKSSWTPFGIVYPNTAVSFSQIAVGTSGQLLQSGGAAAAAWTTATYPATSGTSGYFLRSNGTNIISTSHSLTLDDISDGSSFQRVAAADVSASGHVNRWQVADTAGYATIAGPTGAIAITVDDAAQTLAARNRDNTFTENNTFGNADTDTLTIRSLIQGGNSRAVQIASAYAARTYATGVTEVYIEGDLEVGGTAYSAGGFISTGAGDSYLSLTNNAVYDPGSGYQLYFEGSALKVYDGTEKNILDTASAPTLTGATWSFASVTNLVLPTAVADASGEISMSSGNRLMWHDGTKVVTIDTTPTNDGYVLKYDNATATFTLETDETGTTPYWNSIANPSGAMAIALDSGETTYFQYTGNFALTQGSQFLIEQKTGNPTAGSILFEVKASDSDVTVAKFGDGTNAISIGAAGGMTLAGTASITAGGIVLGDSTADGAGEVGYASNAFSISNGSEDLIITAGTNLWTFSSSTGASSIRFASGVTVDAPLFLNGHVYPGAADSYNLGSGTSEFANLYLGDGAIIYGQNDQSATLTSAASLWTANNFAVDTQFKLPSSDAAPTATAGYIRHDSTVTNYTGGAIVYSSGTTPFQIVAMPSAFAAICSDGQFAAYDATLDYWKCVTASGTGDFKADGTVPMTAAIVPNAVNTIALGSAAAEWADLYLGDGAIIYGQNDSSATLTSSASLWTANNFTVAAAGALTIPQSAAPTVDAVGEIAFDTTASQLVSYSGVTGIVLGGVTEVASFAVSGVTDADDHFIMTAPYNITVKEVSAVQRRNAGAVAGVPTTINIQECTGSAPGTCTDLLATDWILSGSTTAVIYKSAQTDFSRTQVARKNIMKLDVASGCTDSDLTVTVVYWINRE